MIFRVCYVTCNRERIKNQRGYVQNKRTTTKKSFARAVALIGLHLRKEGRYWLIGRDGPRRTPRKHLRGEYRYMGDESRRPLTGRGWHSRYFLHLALFLLSLVAVLMCTFALSLSLPLCNLVRFLLSCSAALAGRSRIVRFYLVSETSDWCQRPPGSVPVKLFFVISELQFVRVAA